jgi:hypothetical protein
MGDQPNCGASQDIVKAHEHLLANLDVKMDEILTELKTVTVLNGDDGQTPTTMSRKDFNQMLYNRTSLRHKLNVASVWSSKIIPIGVVAIFLLSIILLWLGQKDLVNQLQSIKVK